MPDAPTHPTSRGREPILLVLLAPVLCATPNWAEDLVVFQSDRDGDQEVYAMAEDGSGQVNLTNSPGTDDEEPAWAPDGSAIAFVREDDLWLMNPDGSSQTALLENGLTVRRPRWSADGETIYFGANGNLYSIPPGGGAVETLLDDAATNRDPSPTPDGLHLVYSRQDGGDIEIWRLALGGGTTEELTDATNRSQSPSVSPDGKLVAFYSNRDGTWSTWTMKPDGSDPARVRANARPTAWSPDGKRLYGMSYPSLDRILSFDLDGEDLVQLTDGSAIDQFPHALPVLFADGFESGDTSAWQ